MKFDVVVGNPPYQLSTAGSANGAQAKPVYQMFVLQAKKLNPKHLVMIIPARWYTGGWSLDMFRDNMISDNNLRELHDFPDSNDCFPGVQIKGGVCYFHWSRDESGACNVYTYSQGTCSKSVRFLKEKGIDALIRFNESVSILHKVRSKEEHTIDEIVSSQKPFGLGTSFRGDSRPSVGAVKLYQNGGVGYVDASIIPKGRELLNSYKVYISAAYGAGEDFPHQILNKPILGEEGSCCTETYVMIGAFDFSNKAQNLLDYIKTKFFRFMVMILKNSQHALKKVYRLVPLQDFSKSWTDAELYAKYNLTQAEIAFIESMIKPME